MAAKLILSMDGVVLQEYILNKERMTIGRKAHNDIVIDNLAVSGEHAAIVTILSDSFLEDLDSTNGVMVNGAAVKKHFLQNNDLIEIGKYKLKYLNEQQGQGQVAAEDFEKTMVLRAPAKPQPVNVPQARVQGAEGGASKTQVTTPPVYGATGKFDVVAPQAAAPRPAAAPAPTPAVAAAPAQPASVPLGVAAVQILSGPNSGKELELVKNLTTLGKPGVQVAVLTRRPHGFFITHVEGANRPMLNGKALDEHPHQLNDHDIIELAGIKMEFYFKN